MKIQSIFLALFLSLNSGLAAEIQLGKAIVGGSGCPSGSASVSLGSDQKSIHLEGNPIRAQVSPMASFDRKSCNIVIPVQVSPGYRVALLPVEYRGRVSLTSGATAHLDIETFFAGERGQRASRRFSGPQSEDYTWSVAPLVHWSSCGESVNLRVNLSLRVQAGGPSKGTQGTASVDRMGDFQLKVESCQGEG